MDRIMDPALLSTGTMQDSTFHVSYGCQTHVEWKIQKFLDLPTETGYSLKSPSFVYNNEKFYLCIYPNGVPFLSVGWIHLYLWMEDATKEHRTVFRIGIKTTDGSELKSIEKDFTISKSDTHRVIFGEELFQRSKLQNSKEIMTQDQCLIVFCTLGTGIGSIVTSTTENASQTQPLHDITNLSESLKNLYLSKRFTDVTIKVKSREFLAHRIILASRSAVFASMFEHDTDEKMSGSVEISDCDADSFEDFLIFLYSGKFDIVTSSNAVSLYKTSDKYDVEELKKECVRCMTRMLTVETFCDVLHLASMHSESDLLRTATDFFKKNTKNILMSPKWHTFIYENPLLSNELFLKTF